MQAPSRSYNQVCTLASNNQRASSKQQKILASLLPGSYEYEGKFSGRAVAGENAFPVRAEYVGVHSSGSEVPQLPGGLVLLAGFVR
jgi:hypothetical protein